MEFDVLLDSFINPNAAGLHDTTAIKAWAVHVNGKAKRVPPGALCTISLLSGQMIERATVGVRDYKQTFAFAHTQPLANSVCCVLCEQKSIEKSHLLAFSRNLVDPASCHMLVSRTKPCKCESTRGLPREVCVRLIKRFIVYPTKDVHLPPQRDNFANCKANTCMKNFVPFQQEGTLVVPFCGAKCGSPKQKPTPMFRQLPLLRQANVAKASAWTRCWTNLPPIRLKVV